MEFISGNCQRWLFLPTVSRSKMLAFVEGGNQRTRRKTFRAWTTVNNKLNPHMKTDLGIEPRPQCGDASILSIVLSLLPWLNQIMLKYSIPMQHHSFFGNLTIYFYYSKGWLPKNRYCSLLDKLHCCISSLKSIWQITFLMRQINHNIENFDTM